MVSKHIPHWVFQSMRGILVDADAISDWYDMEIPALDNRTPRDIIESEDDWTPVCKVIESYYDPSYS